jgi:hypothetical protein
VRPCLENTHHKKRAGMAQGVDPELKPQYHKEKIQTGSKSETLKLLQENIGEILQDTGIGRNGVTHL